MDGVRAYWNGMNLMSKHGKEILCPNWFTSELPHKEITLDGELWLGRGTLEVLTSLIHSPSESNIVWKNVLFLVFDLPSSKESYEGRMCSISRLKLPEHVNFIDIIQCKNNEHLHQCLIATLRHGGEGLMAIKPHSQYIANRTDTILKVKVFQKMYQTQDHRLKEMTKFSCLKSFLWDYIAYSIA